MPTDERPDPRGGTPRIATHRIALGLEYDGTAFFGWQTQRAARSVQQTVVAAVSAVADEPVTLAAAGRTDAGVHATCQVVHFDSIAVRSGRSWLLGINSNLPEDVAVTWSRPVQADFHARYAATCRRYHYRILNAAVHRPLQRHRSWCIRAPLDAARMAQAAVVLVGEHDFTSFRGAGCQARSPVRRLDAVLVTRHRDCVQVECRGTGFLYHMVRNIVGALVKVGCGEAPVSWLAELLAQRDRRLGAVTAPPQGLYLTGVSYPERFALPPSPHFVD